MVSREEHFKAWCSKISSTPEKLEKEFQEKMKVGKEINKNLEEKDLEGKVLSNMRISYKKQFDSKAEKFLGVIIGNKGVKDADDWIRTEVADKIKEMGEEKAKELGYINAKDQVCFNDGAFFDEDGKKQYTPESAKYKWRRTRVIPDFSPRSSFIGYLPNLENKLFVMYNNETEQFPELFKEVEFLATTKSSKKDDILFLNSVAATKFTTVGKETIDFKAIAKEIFEDNCVGFEKIFGEAQNKEDLYKPEKAKIKNFIITRANASKITITEGLNDKGREKNNVIEVSDIGDLSIDEGKDPTGFVNKQIPINFAEGSLVYLVGSPFLLGEENQKSFSVFGVWADPDYSTILPEEDGKEITEENGSSEEDESEEEDF